jgi:DoxX-like family
MASSKVARIGYWVSTVVFVLALGWSAVMCLTEAPKMVATMAHLGYPLYFVKALGVAKLLGLVALLAGWPRLKEWAYAGFAFDLIGACVSHLSAGDGMRVALVPLGFLVLLAISYVAHRRLETASATRGTHATTRPAATFG